MGVFARLFRRSKATKEAAAEGQAGPSEAASAEERPDGIPEPAGDSARAAEPECAEADDGAGIPRQPSAGEVTDNEVADSKADEGART